MSLKGAALLRGCRRPRLPLGSSVFTFQTKVVFLLQPNKNCTLEIHLVSFSPEGKKINREQESILCFYFSALVNEAGLLFCKSGVTLSEEEEDEGAVFLGSTRRQRAH